MSVGSPGSSAACSSRQPRLAPELAFDQRHAGGQRDRSVARKGLRRRLQAGQPLGPEPGDRIGEGFGDGRPAVGTEHLEVFPERAQPATRFVRRAERRPRAPPRRRRRTDRADRRRRTAARSGAAARCRAPGSSDSEASERSRPCAATFEKPWCLTSSRAVFSASCGWPPSLAACSFRRSAWVRRATPSGSSSSSSSARGASRSSSAHSAASSRAPSSAERAAALRRDKSSAARSSSSRLARSCSRCALPAASRWASTVNSLSWARSGVSTWIARARCAAFCARL